MNEAAALLHIYVYDPQPVYVGFLEDWKKCVVAALTNICFCLFFAEWWIW